MNIVFCCRPDNDLYRVLCDMGERLPRYDALAEAIAAAPRGAGLLALGDAYPCPGPAVTPAHLAAARAKGLRCYVEYPAAYPGLALGEPQPTEWERVVVASDWFAPELAAMRIVALHGCWLLPTEAAPAATHMAAAKVAGYHIAVYGLPETYFPILLQPAADVLLATSKLSGFVRGRYAPASAWAAIWRRLLGWLSRDDDVPELRWQPTVGLQAGRDDALPADHEGEALRRAVRWFREHALYRISPKTGAIEGYQANIDHEGRQLPRTWPRSDCIAETAMVLAHDWANTHNPDSRLLAGQLLDYVWRDADFCHDDPNDPAYGLINWSERNPIYYGDDNARVILATLAAGRLLDDDRWDSDALRCILANLRTAGKLGFRHNRLDQTRLDTSGWQAFHEEETITLAPHYQCYLWACYLWGYALTGYQPLLEAARSAIRITMQAYPERWRWTNGLSPEMARMLLPLAFLLRVEDSAEHRGWLARVASDLLAQMTSTGAIREKLGDLAMGRYPPPQSNAAYGTNEAALVQEDGDPVSDLLYTTNFAFLGLHEAAAATGDPALSAAEARLARFLCRIQVRSAAHPYLDGAWMRAFDDELWEYWGSSADLGWGAWCVESGWTNSWIASVLSWRGRGEALYDTALAKRMQPLIGPLAAEMGLPLAD